MNDLFGLGMASVAGQVPLSTFGLVPPHESLPMCQSIDTSTVERYVQLDPLPLLYLYDTRLPDELKLAVLAHCDFATLLLLYDHELWHEFVLETLANSWRTVSFPPQRV